MSWESIFSSNHGHHGTGEENYVPGKAPKYSRIFSIDASEGMFETNSWEEPSREFFNLKPCSSRLSGTSVTSDGIGRITAVSARDGSRSCPESSRFL